MKPIKFISLFLFTVALLVFGTLALTSCASNAADVRYLNFKPESAAQYKEIAAAYERATGKKIIIDTAANNTYEQTLASKMSTPEAPTIFQINGPRGYAAWADYCLDLKDSKLYEILSDKGLAITGNDGGVYGIPYVVEGYGIIYNSALTDKYFALADRSTAYTSMEEIDSFLKLKALVEDMQRHKAQLGIDGVFAATSLKTGEDWRWQTHLLNVPLSYEFEESGTDLSADRVDIGFTHSAHFQNIFDLYTDNSTVDKKLLGTKTVADSMAEFALEKCVMVQNGNWAYSQISEVAGNRVLAENMKFLPIYTGAAEEEEQGLCIGTENFYAINKKASPEAQAAALDFLYWLYSSEEGKSLVTDKLGFITPFSTFGADEVPADPLAKEVRAWMNKPAIRSIPWNFTVFPSARFKESFGASLLRYVQGAKSFAQVRSEMIDSWKSESDALG